MSEQEQQPQQPGYEEPDWFLERLVAIANGGSIEFSVTLQVSGFLVCGLLISGKKYFEGFADDFVVGFEDDDFKSSIRESLASLGEDSEVDSEEEEQQRPPFHYIHLKDAHFFHPGGSPYRGIGACGGAGVSLRFPASRWVSSRPSSRQAPALRLTTASSRRATGGSLEWIRAARS